MLRRHKECVTSAQTTTAPRHATNVPAAKMWWCSLGVDLDQMDKIITKKIGLITPPSSRSTGLFLPACLEPRVTFTAPLSGWSQDQHYLWIRVRIFQCDSAQQAGSGRCTVCFQANHWLHLNKHEKCFEMMCISENSDEGLLRYGPCIVCYTDLV